MPVISGICQSERCEKSVSQSTRFNTGTIRSPRQSGIHCSVSRTASATSMSDIFMISRGLPVLTPYSLYVFLRAASACVSTYCMNWRGRVPTLLGGSLYMAKILAISSGRMPVAVQKADTLGLDAVP